MRPQMEASTDMEIFWDASKTAYGFVAYAIQDGASVLIFEKVKVALMKTQTLPTLELLTVFPSY